MATKLFEKPSFPRHIRDRLKRYDRRLDLLWNALKGRWEIWQDVLGRKRVEIRTCDGNDGNSLLPAFGLSIERPIESIVVKQEKKPHRVMVLERDLNEDYIFGRLWLSDVWRFKNAEHFSNDLEENNDTFMRRAEEANSGSLRDMAKDLSSYATNRPFSAGGSKHTDGVRKLSEDRN